MPELSSLKRSVKRLFAESGSLCLWLSGGSDSILLLEVMLEQRKPFGILRFDDGWTRDQRKVVDKVIMEKHLQVFSYPANAHILVGEGDEYGLVSRYAIDGFGNTAMLVKDLVDDPKRCCFDIKLDVPKQRAAPLEWEVHIRGTRSDDRHWLNQDRTLIPPKSKRNIGQKQFRFPLARWTREEVWAALKTYGIDWQKPSDEMDTGNIATCFSCIKTTERVFCPKKGAEIDGVKWDKAVNTAMIRQVLE